MPERAEKDGKRTTSMTTRIPSRLHAHLKSLAKMQYGTIQIMHRAMMAAFLEDEPWTTAPSLWRRTRAIKERDKSKPVGMKYTGWEQVNFSLTKEQLRSIDGFMAGLYVFDKNEPVPVTPSIFLYGACYWWGWFVQPPRWAKEERRAAGLPECLTLRDQAIAEMKKEIELSRLEAVNAARTRRAGKAAEGSGNG